MEGRLEAEMVEREQRATERRIPAARFSVVKSLETFDFLAIPTLNKKLVHRHRSSRAGK